MITIPLMLAAETRKVLTKLGLDNEISFGTEIFYYMSNTLDFLSTIPTQPKFTKEVWGRIHKVTVESNRKPISEKVSQELIKIANRYNSDEYNKTHCLYYGTPFEIWQVTTEDIEKALKTLPRFDGCS